MTHPPTAVPAEPAPAALYDWRTDPLATSRYADVRDERHNVDRAMKLTDLCDYLVRRALYHASPASDGDEALQRAYDRGLQQRAQELFANQRLLDRYRLHCVLPAPMTAAETALRAVLVRMLEPFSNDCRHDHHGYCQAHFLERDCSVAHAKAVLASAGSLDRAPTIVPPELARGCPTKILDDAPQVSSPAAEER